MIRTIAEIVTIARSSSITETTQPCLNCEPLWGVLKTWIWWNEYLGWCKSNRQEVYEK